jgi:hypothetical protein
MSVFHPERTFETHLNRPDHLYPAIAGLVISASHGTSSV